MNAKADAEDANVPADEFLRKENAELRAELENFSYRVAHELSGPVRTVVSYANLLANDLGAEEAQGARDRIREGGQRLSDTIQALLAYSRLLSRGGSPEWTDSQAVFDDVCVRMNVLPGAVACERLPVVWVDPSQLKMVFESLLDNAIKFRGTEPPSIEVAAESDGEKTVFSFRDHGIGFEAQFCDQIFEMFRRLHSRDVYPGLGVGLAFAKRIVERHGGRIWAKSNLGLGTAVCFSLRCASV